MTSSSPDCELVSAYVQRGSETAFRALVARHVNLVYATALRQLGDPGSAEEITQNVFVILARKAPRLGGLETLAGWLHRTTILEAKARIRAELRRKRRHETAAELASIQCEGASALDALAPLLDEGLLNLRESDRLALMLRFWDERSLREVGNALGVDEDAARKRVARALDRLTEFFRHRGFVVSVGVAALMTSAAKAAPAGLTNSVGTAGLSAGGAAGGFKLFIFHLMSMTKTQTAVACALLAAAPLAWQWHAGARLTRERTELSARLDAANDSIAGLEQDLNQARNSAVAAQLATTNLQSRLVQLDARLDTPTPRAAYRWDDNSPVVRVPKQFLEMLPVSAVGNRRGQLSEQIKEVLQFSPAETEQVQAALDRLLADYYANQGQQMRQVQPTAEDLQGHKPEETRVFELNSISNQVVELRQTFFDTTQSILGAERFKLFQKALADWMPVDDDFHGLSTSMTLLDFDRRERFYRPNYAGTGWLGWSLATPNGGGITTVLDTDSIPEILQPYLQDWIALAKSKTPAKEIARP
jgi:RNA polymerase sigma factor (sigma-70 family)